MRDLDGTDLDLLDALSADPRASYVAIAEHLGLSRNTVQARLTRLEAEGAFLAFDRRIAPEALGHPLMAFVVLTVQQKRLASVVAALSTIPEVLQAHGLSGPTDLLVVVASRDTQHLFEIDAAILAIDGVERTETSPSMGELVPFRMGPLISKKRHHRAHA